MSTAKNEAFHRLAGKRLEAILDALRIFGNLAGPSYSWAPDEVLDYLAKIRTGVDVAETRFRENPRRWPRTAAPIAPPPEPEPAPAPAAAEIRTISTRRALSIGDVIREAGNCRETLAEMVVLQRVVIERLQGGQDGTKRAN